MTEALPMGVNHIAFTVSDVERSKAFYCNLLGFQEVAPLPTGVMVGKGQLMLGLRVAPERPIPNDRFDPNRVGLDHLSITFGSRAQLEDAAKQFPQQGVTCGEVIELTDFGIAVLMVRDPDDIQIELASSLHD